MPLLRRMASGRRPRGRVPEQGGHHTRRDGALAAVLRDLRYALRTLAKSPGFAGVAIVTLALGISASTALFSVIHNVLIQPFPYARRAAADGDQDPRHGAQRARRACRSSPAPSSWTTPSRTTCSTP